MSIDVTQVLQDYLAGNRSPDPLNPEVRKEAKYGVTATLEGELLSVTLIFERGVAYCCMDHGCHIWLFDEWRWEKLRKHFAARRIDVPQFLRLDLTCIGEDGAIFFDWSRPDPNRRRWYAFKPSRSFKYSLTTTEGSLTREDRSRRGKKKVGNN